MVKLWNRFGNALRGALGIHFVVEEMKGEREWQDYQISAIKL
jgi:hypothetical protein